MLTMGQFRKVQLAIDKVPQRALGCGPCLSGLNQVYGPNCRTPNVCLVMLVDSTF